MSNTTLALTGHRPDKLFGYDLYTAPYVELGKKIRDFILASTHTHFISGMALGADTLFALVVLKLKITHPEFTLECAIPCLNHDGKWRAESKTLYHKILESADKITLVTNEIYSPRLMQIRNKFMVDNCDELLAIWNGTPGGTKNCIDYAKLKNKHIYTIEP